MPKAKELSRDEMTPFAAALQDWMWDQRPSWPRSKVAQEVGVARGTVDSWFRSTRGSGAKPTIPTKAAVRAVMHVTGWTEAQMKALTGYDELPPLGLYEFIYDEVDKWLPDRALGRDGFDDIERAKVREFLADAHRRYATLGNKRPPRREKAPDLREQSAVDTDMKEPTPLNHKRARTLATSGK